MGTSLGKLVELLKTMSIAVLVKDVDQGVVDREDVS